MSHYHRVSPAVRLYMPGYRAARTLLPSVPVLVWGFLAVLDWTAYFASWFF